MKIIVTGATGLIGGEVLVQALRHPDVTQVIALTRRQLPARIAAHDKLTTVLTDNFNEYTDEMTQKLEGATGCVWSLGLAMPGKGGVEEYRTVNVSYLDRGLQLFGEKLAPHVPGGTKFRVAYVSGFMAVRETGKPQSVWIAADARRVRGESETLTLNAPQRLGMVETFVFRPAFVVGAGSGLVQRLFSSYMIKVDDLAAALLQSVLKGAEKQIVENTEASEMGKGALKIWEEERK